MDYSSLGTVTGACHAPVAGRQGKALADTAPRIPVSIEKPADFEMDGREDFQNSLCLWAAALKQIRLLKGWRSRRGFCKVGTTFEPRQASAEAAHPVPPRRAHDTLQPQDESIIVGYYTSAEVPSPRRRQPGVPFVRAFCAANPHRPQAM